MASTMSVVALAVVVVVMVQALVQLVAHVPMPVRALDNGLGLTPQMGWNSWNHFGCNLNETLVRATADAVVNLGLAKVGYKYINLDDCWALSRDNTSRVVPDPVAFPSGMFALGEYIHSRGLKFGIYSDAGNQTCAGRPGSLGYEAIDALTYAAWGVDYLKYDNCYATSSPRLRYPVMRDALNWTGRPIFFSMCEWGVENPATWASSVGNSWRTTDDIEDKWWVVSEIADSNNQWAAYAGPGHWNDPDMLEVGNGGLTNDEEVTHFSWWALMKAPLIIGADLTSISSDSLSILMNEEVIAVNQDPLGVQGSKITADGDAEMWAAPLSDGSVAIVLVNRNATLTLPVTADFTQLNFSVSQRLMVRDLWAHEVVGTFISSITVWLDPHASNMYKLIPVPADYDEEYEHVSEQPEQVQAH